MVAVPVAEEGVWWCQKLGNGGGVVVNSQRLGDIVINCF